MVFVQPSLENASKAFLEPLTACFGQENIIIYSYFLFFLLFLLCQPKIGRRLNRKTVEHQPEIGRTRTANGLNINRKQVDCGFGKIQNLRDFAQIAQNELKNWQKSGVFGEKKKKIALVNRD